MLVDKTSTKLVPFFPQNLPENRDKFSAFGNVFVHVNQHGSCNNRRKLALVSCILKAACSLKCQNAGQRTKKVVSNRPGLVDFAIGLLNPVLNLPKGQVENRGKIQNTEEL